MTPDRAARNGRVAVRIDAACIDVGHDRMIEFAVTPGRLHVASVPAKT